VKPIGIRADGFIQYRMPDGSIEGRSCAEWIPPLCAKIGCVLQKGYVMWLAVKRRQWKMLRHG
jgi:hypothetical protein